VPELKNRLRQDMTAALRAREEVRLATLRMVLAAVQVEEVAGTEARELSDDEVTKVLTKEAKKRREAAEAFAGAGRAESAERERAELGVIEQYLPQQLGDDELSAAVTQAVEAARAEGVVGMPAMGRVMKSLQPQLAGRVDGAKLAAEVRRQLQPAG
jgi:uncharacterized protein YqeY